METDSKLIERRQELKNEITAGINKTPMARLFIVTGKIVQKITRYPEPLPMLYCSALLAPMILLPGLFVMILFRESDFIGGVSLFSVITTLELMLLMVVGAYFNVNKVLISIRDTLVDSIVSFADLSNLHQWLNFGWSSGLVKRFLFWWIILVGSVQIYFFYFVWELGDFGFGFLISLFVSIILVGIGWYYIPLMLLLPMRLRFYQFNLYKNDPARSEVIENITTLMNRYIYGLIFLFILFQLSFASTNFPITLQFFMTVVFAWAPVIVQYLVNQASIRNIISSSKRKTLNRIQAQIREFHNRDITNKENIETINRLMDYHERIRKTPDSGLNVESVLRFLNQLILPLIAFLLGNLETVIKFFAKP